MFELMEGSMFDSGCEALVCPVNTEGVMGAGLALKFKQLYPGYFWDYHDWCENRHATLGECHVWVNASSNPKHIISFPTKAHWANPSEQRWVDSGLDSLVKMIDYMDIKSIAVPALGCGLGGLSWGTIYPLIHQKLGRYKNVEVKVYPPRGN